MGVSVGSCQVLEHSLNYSPHRAYLAVDSATPAARHLLERAELSVNWREIQISFLGSDESLNHRSHL